MTKKKPPELKLKVGRKKMEPEQHHKWTLAEIMERCDAAENECWEWVNANVEMMKSPHGRRFVEVIHGGKRVALRRLCWELYHGKPPDDDKNIVMAKCDNPRCNNPMHGQQMTESQKCKRASKKGNFSGLVRRMKIAAGKRKHGAKITMEIARKIRADNRPGHVAAPEYGIHKSLYNRIKAGKAWVDYEDPLIRMAA